MTIASRARTVRTIAIVLQVVALVVVGTALYGVAWAALQSASGRTAGPDAWTGLELGVLLGLLAIGIIGLRRWMKGGSPTLLYGFDVLPLLFVLFTAGPGALQDPLGLGIAAAFAVPAVVTWAASGGGGSPR